ncbi:hypothetical protein KM043_012256 [Ampulex compressa]|nr:hypothetical protein KM043_012256 [Ampulex compressa]
MLGFDGESRKRRSEESTYLGQRVPLLVDPRPLQLLFPLGRRTRTRVGHIGAVDAHKRIRGRGFGRCAGRRETQARDWCVGGAVQPIGAGPRKLSLAHKRGSSHWGRAPPFNRARNLRLRFKPRDD